MFLRSPFKKALIKLIPVVAAAGLVASLSMAAKVGKSVFSDAPSSATEKQQAIAAIEATAKKERGFLRFLTSAKQKKLAVVASSETTSTDFTLPSLPSTQTENAVADTSTSPLSALGAALVDIAATSPTSSTSASGGPTMTSEDQTRLSQTLADFWKATWQMAVPWSKTMSGTVWDLLGRALAGVPGLLAKAGIKFSLAPADQDPRLAPHAPIVPILLQK